MSERYTPRGDFDPQGTNAKTIATYENRIQEYVEGTPHEVSNDFKEWMDTSLEGLPADALILELGSGFGRDARYIAGKGYQIECTDATRGFVDMLGEQGFTAYELNALTDYIPGPNDLVLANAVLLHFNPSETAEVLRKVHDSLSDQGRFAFSLKQGDGEAWSDEKLGEPRYFCYWQRDEIEQLLRMSGYSNVEVTGDHSGSNALWLHIVAYK